MRALDLIVAPFDVDRQDTPAALAPRELITRKLAPRLRRRGPHVYHLRLHSSARKSREAACWSMARLVHREVRMTLQAGRLPIVLAGGCLTGAVGCVAALGREAGVVWLDAHGDLNTPETTRTGNWDGMALATVLGLAHRGLYGETTSHYALLQPVEPRRVVHLGGRDFDPPEVEAFARLGIRTVPPAEVASAVTRRSITRRLGGRPLYLHLDLDVCDPVDLPAVAYPTPGGVRLDDLVDLLAQLPPPAAASLASASFAGLSEADAERSVEAILRLLTAIASDHRRPRAGPTRPRSAGPAAA